jgi:hypothetical protein
VSAKAASANPSARGTIATVSLGLALPRAQLHPLESGPTIELPAAPLVFDAPPEPVPALPPASLP